MDNSNLASFRGALGHFFQTNPNAIAPFYDQFDLGDDWIFGTGTPGNPAVLNRFYIDIASGRLFKGVDSAKLIIWEYQVNLFASSEARIMSKYVPHDELQAAGGDHTSYTFNLPVLGPNEVVTKCWVNLGEMFVDSGAHNDLGAELCDPDDNIVIYAVVQSSGAISGERYMNAFESDMTGNTIDIVDLVNHCCNTKTQRNLTLHCHATDLTLLTAGAFTVYYKIETFPSTW